MATIRQHVLAFAFLTAIINAAPAAAQSNPNVPARPVSTVYVRSIGGDEVRGQLLRLGPDSLTLLEQGSSRDIRLADVARIDARGDSVKNGAIIGAAVLAGWCAIVCPQGLDGYNNSQLPIILAINTALGAAVGAGIDAMHVGRTTIYRADGVTARRSGGRVRAALSMGFRF
jgi:hypothetical protein